MSTGRLKPQYNRVRASNALQVTGIWANTIGVEQEMGANTAIEDAIYAPGHKRGSRKDKQQRAQELMQAAGYKPAVTDYEGLKALAKAAVGGGTTNRGACRVCGGLGHLTKQCRNLAAAAAAAEGKADTLAAKAALPLLTEADDADGLDELLSSGSGGSFSSGSSGSSSDSDDERRSSKKRKRHGEKKSKKSKKEKKEKRKKEKSHKHKKRSRKERSRSP